MKRPLEDKGLRQIALAFVRNYNGINCKTPGHWGVRKKVERSIDKTDDVVKREIERKIEKIMKEYLEECGVTLLCQIFVLGFYIFVPFLH